MAPVIAAPRAEATDAATILLVEDDVSCRSFLRDLLEFDHYRIIAADSGAQTLEILRPGSPPPDLLVVDFSMDHMNGFELIRELKGRDDMRGIPILMLTATHKKIQEIVELEVALPPLIEDETDFQPVPQNPASTRPSLTHQPIPPSPSPLPELPRLAPQRPAAPLSPKPPPAPQPDIATPVPAALCDDAARKLVSLAMELTQASSLQTDAEGSPAVRLIDSLLDDAIQRGASDIHLEPQSDGLRVRVRVDGTLNPLLRGLCQVCRTEGALTPEESVQLSEEERQRLARVWRARGCPQCHGIGYRGRRAIFEVMPVTSHAMRAAVIQQASPETLRDLAAKEGMLSLRHEALDLVASGLTSPEEAFSVLYAS